MTVEEFKAAFPSESNYVAWKAGVSSDGIQRAVVAFL